MRLNESPSLDDHELSKGESDSEEEDMISNTGYESTSTSPDESQNEIYEMGVTRTLSTTNQHIVSRLMQKFWAVSEQIWGEVRQCAEGRSPVASTNEISSQSSQNGNISQNSNTRHQKKRARETQEDQEDQQSSDGDGQNPKRKRILHPDGSDGDRTKFACPYRKHDPQKYCARNWRSCALSPWATVARLKLVRFQIYYKIN